MPRKKLIQIDINIRGITVKNQAKRKEIIDWLKKEIRKKAREHLESVEEITRED